MPPAWMPMLKGNGQASQCSRHKTGCQRSEEDRSHCSCEEAGGQPHAISVHQPLTNQGRQHKLLLMVSKLGTTCAVPSEVAVKARAGRREPQLGANFDLLLQQFQDGGCMNSALEAFSSTILSFIVSVRLRVLPKMYCSTSESRESSIGSLSRTLMSEKARTGRKGHCRQEVRVCRIGPSFVS